MQVARVNLSFAELTENRQASNESDLGGGLALQLELLVEYDAFH